MKKQNFSSLFSAAVFFSSLPVLGYSLPGEMEVKAGSAKVMAIDPHTVEINVSDKAILQYKHFDIGQGQTVRFRQPSSKSTVLSRVSGKKSSEILGNLESNGKVFLVNPHGIYFGPNSQVNTGSLIASTLDLQDQDFLEGKYRFLLGKQSKGSIYNEGTLNALDGGVIALISPRVQNKGIIEAKAGQVILASGREVTLDFVGDGLISFAVEGVIEDSLVENLGRIRAVDGKVFLQTAVARKVIADALNTDGIQEGAVFIEKGGKIFFASESEVESDHFLAEAKDLSFEGKIASEKTHLLGSEISLKGALIDASAPKAGEVLIGGNFQGKGELPYALKIEMDETSRILANSLEEGNGGLVVLWSKDFTSFNGRIEAKGGPLGGNGGKVETSSQHQLIVEGKVDTLSPQGKPGTWLLDPAELFVTTACIIGSPSNCSSFSGSPTIFGGCGSGTCCVNPSLINTASSSVELQAAVSIGIESNITMQNPGCGLSIVGCPSLALVDINCSQISTNGGDISIPSIISLEQNLGLNSTGFNGNTGNGSILTGVIQPVASDLVLSVSAGDQNIAIGALDAIAYHFASINLNTTGSVSISSEITTQGTFSITPSSTPLLLTSTFGAQSTIDLTNSGGFPAGRSLTLGDVNVSESGLSLTVNTGTSGDLTIGSMGSSSAPLQNINLTAASLTFQGDQYATGTVQWNGPVVLPTPDFTVSGGTVSFSGSISGQNINVIDTNSLIVASTASLSFTGNFTESGGGVVSLFQNLSAPGGYISLGDALSLQMDTTLSTGSNNPISIGGATNVDAVPYMLTLNSGTGALAFTGTIGTESNPLKTVSLASSPSSITLESIYVGSTGLNFGSSPITLGASSVLSAADGPLTFSTINGPYFLTLSSGSGAITTGNLGGITALAGVTVLSTSNYIASNITTNPSTGNGSGAIDIEPTMTGSGSIVFDTTNAGAAPTGANISIVGINGSQALTLKAGSSSTVSLGTTILDSLDIVSALVINASDVTALTGSILFPTTSDLVLTQTPSTLTAATSMILGSIDGNLVSGIPSTDKVLVAIAEGGNLSVQAIGSTVPLAGLTLEAVGSTVIQNQEVIVLGDISYSGTAIDLFGNITSGGGFVNLESAEVFLETNPVTISASGNISMGNIDGSSSTAAQPLTLISSSGAASFGALSSYTGIFAVDASTINQQGSITLAGSVNYNQRDLSVTTRSINLNGSITTTGSGNNISLNGIVTLETGVSLSSGGGITVSNNIQGAGQTLSLLPGSYLTLTGALGSASAGLGAVSLTAGSGAIFLNSIYTAGATITFNGNPSIALNGNATLSTTANSSSGAAMSLGSGGFTGGSKAYSLTLDAGSSSLTVGNLGVISDPLGSVTIYAAAGWTPPASILTAQGAISIHPSVSLASGSTTYSMDTTSSFLLGSNITFFDTINGPGALTLNAGTSGAVSFQGAVGFGTALASLTVSSANIINQSSSVATSGAISYTLNGSQNEVVLNGNLTAGSSILLEALSNSMTVSGSAESLVAGTSITVDGSISLSANTATINAGTSILLEDDVTLIGTSVDFSAGTSIEVGGNISLSGNTADFSAGTSIGIGGNISLSGTSADFSAGTTLTIEGAISGTTLTALTLLANDTLTLEKNIGSSSAGIGSVSMIGGSNYFNSIYTAGEEISISGPSTLNGNATLSTTTGGALGAEVFLQDALNGGGVAYSLTILAGDGTVDIQDLGSSQALGNVEISGASDFALPSNIVTSGAAVVIHPSVLLGSNAVITTTAAPFSGGTLAPNGASITFGSTVDGAKMLVLNAGTSGNISFAGNIGSLTPLQLLDFVNANNILLPAVSALGIAQEQGSGTTAFTEDVLVSGSSGINLHGTNFSFASDVTVSADTAPTRIVNAGSLVIGPNADFLLSGPFFQLGSGTVYTAASVTTQGSDSRIVFRSPIVLTGDVSLETLAGTGSILIASTVDGSGTLSAFGGEGAIGSLLASSLGNVVFLSDIGSNFPVVSLDLEAQLISFNGTSISSTQNQLYRSPTQISESTNWSAVTGSITFEEVLNPSAEGLTAQFSLGGGNLTFDSSLGNLIPLASLLAYNMGIFSAETIETGFLQISGGLPSVFFHGDVDVTGLLGTVINASALYLGADVSTRRLFLRTQGSMSNLSDPPSFTIFGTPAIGFDFVNAANGVIGSFDSPLTFNTSRQMILGANPRADLAGTLYSGLIDYYPQNVPCIVTLNGVLLRDCEAISSNPAAIFNTLPKRYFYVPGIYSSWDNLSNEEYFLTGPFIDMDTTRDRTFFWMNALEGNQTWPEDRIVPVIQRQESSKHRALPRQRPQVEPTDSDFSKGIDQRPFYLKQS
jgi:filamentous hemagglutinin family protein